MIEITWNGSTAFEASTPSGSTFTMDSYPDVPGTGLGPTPLEAFLSSLAGCSAIDVISILKKKRQEVTGYRLEIEGERADSTEYPRPFVKIKIRHFVTGNNIDPDALKRAIELSEDKYCTVASTLRFGPEIESEWAVE